MSTHTNLISRIHVLGEAQELLNKRNFTKEDRSKFESLLQMADALATVPGTELRLRTKSFETAVTAEERAFRNYLKGGRTGLNDEDLKVLRKPEARDLTSGGAYPGSTAGFLAPVAFEATVYAMLKQIDQLFDENVVTRIETERGTPVGIPNVEDTGNAATKISENSASTETDPTTVDGLNLAKADSWRSGLIRASMELVNDSGIPFEAFLATIFAIRYARGIGADNVATLMAAATLGATATGSAGNDGGSGTGANSIGSDDLESLIDSVDHAYQVGPKTGFGMNPSTRTAIRKLKDKNGRPLKLIERAPDGTEYLYGWPIRICPAMDSIGHSKKPVVFGDLGRLIVRTVKNSLLLTRSERFAEYGQVAFLGILRANAGAQVTTGSSQVPFKYLQNA
jgi:HK97 family phage major capsid protein